jgi:hypothetical protein
MLNFEYEAYGQVVSLKDYYIDKMVQYADEATKSFSKQLSSFNLLQEYVDCVAVEYTEGNKSAEMIFDSLGLKEVHAWALQNKFNAFCESFDETEVYDNE